MDPPKIWLTAGSLTPGYRPSRLPAHARRLGSDPGIPRMLEAGDGFPRPFLDLFVRTPRLDGRAGQPVWLILSLAPRDETAHSRLPEPVRTESRPGGTRMRHKSLLLTLAAVPSLFAWPNSVEADFSLPFVGGTNNNSASLGIRQFGKGPAIDGSNWYGAGPGIWEGPVPDYVGVYGFSYEGHAAWFESGNDQLDLVLGGPVGRINTDPRSPSSDLILSSNNDVDIRLDNDGGGNGVFNIRNSTGAPVASVDEAGTLSTRILQIRGGADLSENFEIQTNPIFPPLRSGLVVSIDPAHPGKLMVASEAYDKKVAGIVSGGQDINPGIVISYDDANTSQATPVALSGRVYSWADASSEAIRPGDLLTTSATPGHAMRATDHERAPGAIIGKAMTGLDSGTGLVLVLISLQ
jgi:hypothetical protein